jgi:hypothetical protein
MSRPSKAAERLARTEALRDAVNAYRAQKPGTEPPQATKPKRRGVPLDRPSEIPGYPVNDSPPAEAPDYGTMSRVQAITHRQRKIGARLPIKPIGEPELIKCRDLRTWRAAE